MSGLGERIVGLFLGGDEAINALGGGSARESLSGTFGRALGLYGGKRQWWGPPAVAVVNAGAWVIARQADHCQTTAALEAARRAAEQTFILPAAKPPV
ncbi:MAG: hypothetical protein JWQ97_4065 [Phenylobacterium sp.]|nr:hypothetical protein [Phenylobacterium sp.]